MKSRCTLPVGAGRTDGTENAGDDGARDLGDCLAHPVQETAVAQDGPVEGSQIASKHAVSVLVCPQCAGEFTAAHTDFAPKLLPCFHSVCATCAIGLKKFKGPGRRCPVCLEAVGYEDLVDDFVVLDLLAARQLESARYAACLSSCPHPPPPPPHGKCAFCTFHRLHRQG